MTCESQGKLFLTFDIEEWFHANYDGVDLGRYDSDITNLDDLTDRLIDICAEYGITATCFVLGSVAKRKPAIVRRLHRAGHEIASHGSSHRLVHRMKSDEFRHDLATSIDILRDIVGEDISGFRAPSWSIKRPQLDWYYDVLAECGLTYSSSVYPGHTFLFGIPGFPTSIHRPLLSDGRCADVFEVPVPVIRLLTRTIGFSGGAFFRMLPRFVVENALESSIKAGESAFVYLHPREIDIEQPRLQLPWFQSFVHYWGVASCERKLRGVLSNLREHFIPLGQHIRWLSTAHTTQPDASSR